MNETATIFMTMIESTLNKMIDNRIEAKQDEKLQTLWDEVRSLNERIKALEEKAQNPTLSVAVMDLQSEQFRDAVREIADEAVDEHCGEHDHDLIHEDEVDEDAIDTALRQALRGARIELR